MTTAETAQLRVHISLKDDLSAGVAAAQAKISGLHGSFSNVSTAAGKFGGALSHAGSQLKSFVTLPLGLLGVGGALTFVGAIEKGITKAQDFGAEVRRLIALTGQSAESMSALAAGFEHFGVGAEQAQRSIGFLEKNVGLLAARKNGIKDFQTTFGLALTDQNGKLKTANELILTSADYFNNKSIPASTKAAALAKLYGRSWQDLIPVLSAGRAGLQAAEEEAAKLGLTLSGQNLKDLVKLRDATRDWNTALGGLQLQIGLALVPLLTDLSKAATGFVRDNKDKIVGFFRDGAKFAKDMAATISTSVIPTLKGIGSAAASAWGAIPPEFRDLIIKGLVVGKVSKILFGFGPLDLLKGLGGGLLKGLGGSLFSRGSTPANPLFVSGVGVGGIGGPGGLASEGGSALSKAASLLSKALLVGFVAEAAMQIHDIIKAPPDIPASQLSWPWGPKNTPTILPNIFGGNGLLGGDGPSSKHPTLDFENRPKTFPGKAADDLTVAIRANTAALKGGHPAGVPHPKFHELSGALQGQIIGGGFPSLSGKSADDLVLSTVAAIKDADSNIIRTGAATKSGLAGVVGAIHANRPMVTTNVNVTVSGNSVTKSVQVTDRYGSALGSRSVNASNPYSRT